MEERNLSQSGSYLHQALEEVLRSLSRAGISVVESREITIYGRKVVDLVIDKPLSWEYFNELYKYLAGRSIQLLQLNMGTPVLRLVELEEKTYRFKWLLTVVSLITIGLTGYGLSEAFLRLGGRGVDQLALIMGTLTYTVLFTVVLVAHELGHIYVSRRTGVRIDGPVLIPAPPIQLGFLGTFGAVIFMRTIPPSRRELAKLGISGPLVGFIAATIVGLIGLYMSPVISLSEAARMMESGELSSIPVSSLILELLITLRTGSEEVLVFHPLLFIAYVMYLITFLNLLPIGQLDGGHVARAFTSMGTHRRMGLATVILLLAVGVAMLVSGMEASYFFIGLGTIAALLYLLVARHPHPGYANQYDESRCIVCLILYVLIMILVFPLPLF